LSAVGFPLASLLEQDHGLRLKTTAGLWQVLRRLDISYKRARDYVHSPDRAYDAKRARIEQLKVAVQSQPQEALVFCDEFSFYRQPSLARGYESVSSKQPCGKRAYQSNTLTRIVGTLDAHSARVQCWLGAKVGIEQLVAFFQHLSSSYGEGKHIWMVLDNWPVHFHPEVLVALEPQQEPFPFPRPKHWPSEPSAAAQKRWGPLHLPIQLVVLPTYASWLNPIEKLWRKLNQDLLHLHRWADDLQTLRCKVTAFLQRFAQGSADLLHSVGLHVPY
jgi:hypothetical protein